MIKENKAQISVELIILLAAVVAVALILITQLQKTGTKGTKLIAEKSDKLFDKISDIK
ncbi:MAG: class III signal peptide-containing protein [archaeon]|nr:class III signal peptide-containing protein [Candidatus Micrarchaeota archaeon]